jgi:HD-like signal output (HDOD) protein/AmiR/NasT family two-component response regulator
MSWAGILPAMNNRILFVDDEPMLLKGLERSLRGMRNEWEMHFVPGGAEALEAMAKAPFDVVISDMRMPGMDGAELLDLVRKRFSQTVRMVLSGQSDKDAVFRAIRPTHQYLSKPCDIEELKQKLKCALALRDVLRSGELKRRVSQMESVPSPPSTYRKLRAQLESAHPNLQEAAEIVSRDPGMTAKIPQLVNSAFLGSACRLSYPKQAVSIIGLENFRSLVLTGSLFSELPETLAAKLAELWRHSYSSAVFAEAIARCEEATESTVQSCYAAGLLHEIGWIVLASTHGDQFESLGAELHEDRIGPVREQQLFGSTHGEVGAYLLGLWGVQDSIVEAVAGHENPLQLNPTGFCPLLAVHVAERWDREWHGRCGFKEGIDENLLAQLGLKARLPVWEKKCREIDERWRREPYGRENSSGG